ncbi:MAG: prepilin peptidase [Promethearchaeota archaeon]
MYFVNLISVFIFLAICVYYDLKNRIIPNRFLKIYFTISLILIIFDFYYYLEVLYLYVIIKSIIFGLVFIFSLILFSLKLIGGGDGKVLILFFHSLPFMYLTYFFKYFFLVFGLFLYIIAIIKNITKAKSNNNEVLEILRYLIGSMYSSDSKLNSILKRNDLIELRKKKTIPLTLPILFSYVTMTLYFLLCI